MKGGCCRGTLYTLRSGLRMRRTVMWLLASLAFGSLSSLGDGAPMQVMSAPNLLRVGTAENIFVECQDYTGADIRVEIRVMNHPTKNKRLGSASVTLTNANHFQAFGEIKIPPEDFSLDPNMKQYVYLQAQFPGRLLEKVVLVSFQSGYIFIQTDKTLYTPGSRVHYRMFAVTPRMEPVEREDAMINDAIDIAVATPEGFILPLTTASLRSGIYSSDYQLDEIFSPGVWKMMARFQSSPQQSYSAEFEVKEYVLPSFEVKLMPLTSFFYVDSQEFPINIKATYLFGEEVDGTAYVVFGVIRDGQKRSLPGSLQRVPILRGHGVVSLRREHISQTFNIMDLVGSSIFVAVSVLTESGGEMVEAELRDVQIVTSPYTITFKKTPKYFKPRTSFDVSVEVANPDGSPAQGVPVVVEPGSVQGHTAANGMAKLTINTASTTRLSITAKTNDPAIPPERQAAATMAADSYTTRSNNFIHIGVDAAEVRLGENLRINFIFSRPTYNHNDITYLFLSRGQLVKHGRYKARGEVLISLKIPISKEMLPSFRIIAYYHTSDNEVVSDSVWVDVKDSCIGGLRLEAAIPAPSYNPRSMFRLKITGDPGATVGLVAVDSGVYVLNNKYRLTQQKVWDAVEKFDTGCTPGGGRDSMGVFYDAGLLFESSTGSGTPYRQEFRCPVPSRRRRDTTVMEVTTSSLSDYKDEHRHDCCQEGLKKTPVSHSCEIRSRYIVDDKACVKAFLQCCREMENQRADQREDNLQLIRSKRQEAVTVDSGSSGDDDRYLDNDEIVARTRFSESWLWSEVKLSTCPPNNLNCDTTSYVKSFPLPDSLTTRKFIGISLSRTHGICVSEPLEVITRKEFFIDLRLPYSAVKGEQIEVKAILHNYSPDSATVRVDLMEEENVCSAASKLKLFRQEVTVGPMTTRSVPFLINPVKEGEYHIWVKAAVRDTALSDGVIKVLHVVPKGVLVKSLQFVILNPATKGIGGIQEEILNSGIPNRDLVPNTPTRTQISVTGGEGILVPVEKPISGHSMENLFVQPGGTGENVIKGMTLPVIATTYLDKTNQWETVGFQKRGEALQCIRHGYQRQLVFRKTDGSFALFNNQRGSTWLTAYVAKVLIMANNLVEVHRQVICDAVKFLILNAQQLDGRFGEVGRVNDKAMIGDVEGVDSDASMTAFCLIAIQETRTLCSEHINSLPDSVAKAVAYLENRLPGLTNPYAVAMASYALAKEDKLNRAILYRFISPELSHWPVAKGQVYTLEATAYALLALVEAKAFEDARPVVRWLNKQQKVRQGYGSTQATIMVYQAVAEYWVGAKELEHDLNVHIMLPGKLKPVKYNFNSLNIPATRTAKISTINENITVTATGTGEASLRMVSMYYALPREQESDCQKFNLSVQLIPERVGEDETIYRLRIEILYKDPDHDATMSILDVGLLTGFTVNTQDLDLLSRGRARTIAKYEMNTALSERGSLIIYLDKVSHTRPAEISFRIHQMLKVGVLQPAAVSVYEYYDPQTPCMKFYHPERKAGQLMQLCNNDECICAEETCTMQKKGTINTAERIFKACESTQTSKTDFVYKVSVEQFTESSSNDIYKMRVVEVIREGQTDVGPWGKLRTFLSFQHCRESLDLRIGKTYLIMGTSEDIHRDEQNLSYQYVLSKVTWIEYWPTAAECQINKYQPICLGIEDLVSKYELFGCQQ